MLSIELESICRPIRYLVSNWGYQVAQFDAEYRIGSHIPANSIVNIELGLSSAPNQNAIENSSRKKTKIHDLLFTVRTV